VKGSKGFDSSNPFIAKKTLFVCESPCKSVAKKIGGGFWPPEGLIIVVVLFIIYVR